MKIAEYREKINRKLIEHKAASERLRIEQKAFIEAEDALTYAQEGQEILQVLAKEIQQRVHRKIADIVSRCLSAVFDEPYEFVIRFEEKRGRTEADLLFVRNGMEVDPLTASGGGVVDVASFALRLACLLLRRPPLRRLLVLDEPFKHLSIEYRPKVRNLLLTLSEEMDVQFLIVTHDPIFKIGKAVELG